TQGSAYGPAVKDRPGEEDIRESFLTAVLDAIPVDRPSRRPAVADEIASDILAAHQVVAGSSPDESITTEESDDGSPGREGASEDASALQRLADGLKGLLLGAWLTRVRPNQPAPRTDKESDD